MDHSGYDSRLSLSRAWVQSLARKPRSYKLHDTAEKENVMDQISFDFFF